MNIFITYKSYIFKVRERMKNGIWDKMNENQQHTCQIGKMNLTDFEQQNVKIRDKSQFGVFGWQNVI